MYIIKLTVELKTFGPMKNSAIHKAISDALWKVDEFRNVLIVEFDSDLPDEKIPPYGEFFDCVRQASSEPVSSPSATQDSNQEETHP